MKTNKYKEALGQLRKESDFLRKEYEKREAELTKNAEICLNCKFFRGGNNERSDVWGECRRRAPMNHLILQELENKNHERKGNAHVHTFYDKSHMYVRVDADHWCGEFERESEP